MRFIGTDAQSIYPTMTPTDIGSAIEELGALSLHVVSNMVPNDYDLLMLARMTEPILNIAMDLHDVMAANKECCTIIRRLTGEETDRCNDREEALRDERYLHRCDMSTHIVENGLQIEFGSVEGSIGEEVRSYTHRFDIYRSFISDLRGGYKALVEEMGKNNSRSFAAPYADCCSSMDSVASGLVDDFLLRFADPGKSLHSDIGRRILQECGSGSRHVLRLKMERLQQYVESEYAIRASR